MNQTTIQAINQPTKQPTNQQEINHATERPINQPTNETMYYDNN